MNDAKRGLIYLVTQSHDHIYYKSKDDGFDAIVHGVLIYSFAFIIAIPFLALFIFIFNDIQTYSIAAAVLGLVFGIAFNGSSILGKLILRMENQKDLIEKTRRESIIRDENLVSLISKLHRTPRPKRNSVDNVVRSAFMDTNSSRRSARSVGRIERPKAQSIGPDDSWRYKSANMIEAVAAAAVLAARDAERSASVIGAAASAAENRDSDSRADPVSVLLQLKAITLKHFHMEAEKAASTALKASYEAVEASKVVRNSSNLTKAKKAASVARAALMRAREAQKYAERLIGEVTRVAQDAERSDVSAKSNSNEDQDEVQDQD